MARPARRFAKYEVLLICIVAMAGCQKMPSTPEIASSETISQEFRPEVVIPNSFPPIVNPRSVTAEEATEQLRPEELVLGVELNGEARAYPINMLTGPQREIVNDQLGGQWIAATW